MHYVFDAVWHFQQVDWMGFTFYFGSLVGSVSSYDVATPTKEIQWLGSVFTGIFFCVVVYRLTAILSSLSFAGYGKLNRAEKIEWNNRGFSTVHALFVSFASFYFVVLSDLFKTDSQEELVINRSSTFSNSVLGISIGYFLADVAMILWHFPALGGLEYVLHHGLSMVSIIQSLLSGQAQIYILMILFSESTTPFVNLRWHLDVAGLKNSKLYVWNGAALFFGWSDDSDDNDPMKVESVVNTMIVITMTMVMGCGHIGSSEHNDVNNNDNGDNDNSNGLWSYRQ
ncbi:hypothetical protein DEO72_LG1g1574 [Vigna unguiculata]|uniref:TLC domain-containing protein n=1 Tax=Vigna unguiculata TaxID=3917 RepID=A0A4D6KJ46_VIGUN|nr:hypothetical protein DEO72_LG1g1574 [Vigna unguiculata]